MAIDFTQEAHDEIRGVVGSDQLITQYFECINADKADATAMIEKFSIACLWGQRHGFWQTSVISEGAGNVQYQFEGARIVATIALSDLTWLGDDVKAG